jgi:hypothetical protein
MGAELTISGKSYPMGSESNLSMRHPSGRESDNLPILHPPGGELSVTTRKSRSAGETALLEAESGLMRNNGWPMPVNSKSTYADW